MAIPETMRPMSPSETASKAPKWIDFTTLQVNRSLSLSIYVLLSNYPLLYELLFPAMIYDAMPLMS